jgi:Arc/MetJ family transcription regulator
MQIDVVLDDELVAKAMVYTGVSDLSLLLNGALIALIERESARRLARLGGTEPGLVAIARRRSRRTKRRER